jgi:hypothetical protein
MQNINDQIVSVIRTFVPVLVGQIITWLAVQGIIDTTGQISGLLISLLTISFTTVYYIIARYLETFVSTKFGWLLGVAKKPVYKEEVK